MSEVPVNEELGKAIVDTLYYQQLLDRKITETGSFISLLTTLQTFLNHRISYYVRIEYILEPTASELENEYKEHETMRIQFKQTKSKYKDVLTVYLWKNMIYWVFHQKCIWNQLSYLWFMNENQFFIDFRKYYYQFYEKTILPIKQMEKLLIQNPEQIRQLNDRIEEGRKARKIQESNYKVIEKWLHKLPEDK